MENACSMKYGDIEKGTNKLKSAGHFAILGKPITGSPLEAIVDVMTEAVMKFELLSQEQHLPVKLYQSDKLREDNKAPGSFVLYNYARICTILNKFEKAVSSG